MTKCAKIEVFWQQKLGSRPFAGTTIALVGNELKSSAIPSWKYQLTLTASRKLSKAISLKDDYLTLFCVPECSTLYKIWCFSGRILVIELGHHEEVYLVHSCLTFLNKFFSCFCDFYLVFPFLFGLKIPQT